MRSFISTPPFRLLVVSVNFSLLFSVIGSGFSSANFSYSDSYHLQPVSRQFRSFQLKHFERLGILPKEQSKLNKQSVDNQKQQSPATESGTNVENGITQENPVQSNAQTKTEPAIETASVEKTQNKTQTDKSSAATGKTKLPARKSFSDVKNLPDAERLRASTPREGIHEVRGSIPLVSTNRINSLGQLLFELPFSMSAK